MRMIVIQEKSRLKWLAGAGLYCIVPMVVTALAFYGVWNNSFTNWDDDLYVTANPLIHSLAWRNILRIFSPGTFVFGNYQPITILSYVLSYAVGRLNPAGYILLDFLLHLLNVLLVFIFIRKISKNDFAAFLCALLFGIHPMHVESVAWISGRKDLLYSFFFLASSILYLSYLERKNRFAMLRYSAAFILFILSLLSKSSSVTLPVVLILIDYFQGRKFSKKAVIDKISFFLPSILIGLWAIKGQHESASLAGYGAVSVFSRVAIACHSFIFYVVNFFIPVKLSAFYPYPDSLPASLPLHYSLSPLVVVASGMVAWYFRRSKVFVFGFVFFLINVIFILHFIPVGATVTADRFSYLAYIGLSIIVVGYGERGFALLRLRSVKVSISAAICFVTLIFVYATHERCKVWKNSVTLWTDVVGKYPTAPAYKNRGNAYYANHDYARAIEDYTMVISEHPSYAGGYNDRGLAYDALGDHARAAEDYSRAIAHDVGFAKAYNNRGSDYYLNGNYDRAINDFERAIALDSGFADAYNNRGNLLNSKGEYAGAIADYSRAVALDPECATAWCSLGRIYQARDKLDQALACFTRSIEADNANVQAYNSRGVLFCMRGDFDHAITDFNRAITLQPSLPDAYANRGNAYGSKGDFSKAINDFSRALSLVSAPANYPQVFFNRGRAYRANGDMEHAGEDFMKACAMHLDVACRELQRK